MFELAVVLAIRRKPANKSLSMSRRNDFLRLQRRSLLVQVAIQFLKRQRGGSLGQLTGLSLVLIGNVAAPGCRDEAVVIDRQDIFDKET